MSKRGRPRELPSQLPQLSDTVATATELQHLQPRASRVVVAEERAAQRQRKQAARAQQLAQQRAQRQVEQLALACQHAQLVAEKTVQRLQERVAREQEQAARLDQLQLRVEAGEAVDLSPVTMRQLKRKAGIGSKRPRLTPSDKRVISELAGAETQAQIADRLGVAQSTVSRQLSYPGAVVRHGRKPKLTKPMLYAAARFQFLFKTRSWLDTAKFIRLAFNVQVAPRTMARNLKSLCGFRLGDFRRFPRDRNSVHAIQERQHYATDMPDKYGQNTLYNAIYFDEMKLSRVTKRKAWSLCGWIPTVEDEFDTDTAEHISLLLAASPAFGVLYFEVIEGSVTGEVVLEFMKEMMANYMARTPSLTTWKRAFVLDNANMHHRSIVVDYLRGEAVSQWIGMEFLPPYSPFLNPLEEIFGLIKCRLWRRRATADITDESKAFVKKSLVEEVTMISEEDARSFYFHVEHFLKYAKDGTPVFTQQLYEDSHIGDEAGLCPLLPAAVENLLASYLPHSYEEFTAEMCADVEAIYGCRRLTLTDVQQVNLDERSDDGGEVDQAV